MKKIFAEESVNQGNKLVKFQNLMEKSGFLDLLRERKKDALIIVKCNFTPASQKNYKYYTDPDLVNILTSRIREEGYSNVFLAESETHFSDAFANLKPARTAKYLGFKDEVINLTNERSTAFHHKNGEVYLSNITLNAVKKGMLINFPMAKNHEVFLMTACLKNMYGSIPDKNKFTLFHQKKSGLDVPQAAHVVNTYTPPHFHFVDFIRGIDGDERALFYKALEEDERSTGIDLCYRKYCHATRYHPTGLLLAGEDGLALDKFISVKMGYKQNQSPITNYHAQQIGDFDIRSVKLVGTTFNTIPNWNKVSWAWVVHGTIEHQLPVNEETIARGIRMYVFDKELIKEEKKD